MKILKNRGMHLISKKIHIIIDPTTISSANDADLVLISHAHIDHIKNVEKINPLKILSRPTFDLLSSNLKKNCKITNFKIIEPYNSPKDEINIQGCKISAFHAGHCLGSFQFRIKLNNKIILYTGDFCLESRFGMNKAPLLKCNNGIFITDDTYFSQEYVFPTRKTLYPKILSWFKETLEKNEEIIIIAQRLGVQQEITALLNYSTLNCSLFTHPSIYKANEIHSSYLPLGKFQYKRHPLEKKRQNKTLTSYFNSKNRNGNNKKYNSKSVILLPYYYVRKIRELEEKYNRNSIMIATGWAKTQNFRVKSFPLSSHAGYDQILDYQKYSRAQKTFFF
ncbi:MAG: MBL fold metallo-hydrolase [Candidatus Helarchaeota archaeon]|nr:MBL fold metallo-hydrolase [Candidatus Helarchaeota archaeon]